MLFIYTCHLHSVGKVLALLINAKVGSIVEQQYLICLFSTCDNQPFTKKKCENVKSSVCSFTSWKVCSCLWLYSCIITRDRYFVQKQLMKEWRKPEFLGLATSFSNHCPFKFFLNNRYVWCSSHDNIELFKKVLKLYHNIIVENNYEMLC